MAKKRPSNTTLLIQRRLDDAERADAPDVMELVGLWDELARLDRKWHEQTAAGSERRSPGDEPKIAGWFERLIRQMERALRDPTTSAPERAALEQALARCRARTPLLPPN